MARTVLLTGATGFIGAHVARRLAADGDTIHALVRPGGSRWRLRDLEHRIRPASVDLLDADAVRRAVGEIRPEMCIHLAWCATPGTYLCDPDNVRFAAASLELARSLAENGCRRLVGAGTCLEYEARGTPLDEAAPVRPTSLYAASKLGLGLMLDHFGRQRGISVAWARLFFEYGPFEDARRLVPSVIGALLRGEQALVSEGGQVRDFLHVEDAAAAIVAVARSDAEGPVNVGSGHPVTVRGLVAQIGRLMGQGERIVYGARPQDPADPPFICADNTRLVQSTEWRPRYDLERGLRDAIAWWEQSATASS
jgi:nucleoside-diphosphate-sugar epimerase